MVKVTMEEAGNRIEAEGKCVFTYIKKEEEGEAGLLMLGSSTPLDAICVLATGTEELIRVLAKGKPSGSWKTMRDLLVRRLEEIREPESDPADDIDKMIMSALERMDKSE